MRQRGSASLELALGAAMLLVPALVAVLSFSPWLETGAFVRAAAAEGARAAVLAGAEPSQAATAAVLDLAASRGFDTVTVEVCEGRPCVLVRGSLVEVRVSIDVPVFATPWGDVGGITVEGAHAEPVDAYRSLP